MCPYWGCHDFDYSDTSFSTENDIILELELTIEEIEIHVSSQDPLSVGADKGLNTTTDEGTDNNIKDPDYIPSSDDESSTSENEDHQAVGTATPEQVGEDVQENNAVKRKRHKHASYMETK